MKRLIVIVIVMVSSQLSAQDFGKGQTTYTVQEEAKSLAADKGTYLIEYDLSSTQRLLLTNDILLMITSERKQSEDVTIEIQNGIRVFIPSKDVVSNPTFTPLK